MPKAKPGWSTHAEQIAKVASDRAKKAWVTRRANQFAGGGAARSKRLNESAASLARLIEPYAKGQRARVTGDDRAAFRRILEYIEGHALETPVKTASPTEQLTLVPN